MARAARHIRFALLAGLARAKRRTWLALNRAGRSDPLRTALHAEADRFVGLMADLSYTPLLPCARISLQRLVVVPRATLAGRARDALSDRLGALPAMAAFDDAVRTFFYAQLVREMDDAVLVARPSVGRPVRAAEEWTCIGVDRELPWIDSAWTGPGWGGHLFMYEFPRGGLSRKERRAVEETVAGMQAELCTLSRSQRHELLRAALDRGVRRV